MDYLNALLSFITHHPGLAYGAIFWVSLSESLALVGWIVPGTWFMLGAGAITATGSLALRLVLLVAVAGAIAGDGISYWLGRHYQEKLRQVWPFSRHPRMLKNGEAFFHRHGGKSVLFGRFVGPIRPVIPVVAGMLGMGPVQFSIVNVISAIGWAMAHVFTGMFFGTSLAVAGAVSMRLAILLFLILAIFWGFIWLVRKLVYWVGLRGPIWLAAARAWVAADTPAHGAVLPVRRFLAYVYSRHHGEELLFSVLVMVFFAAGWAFLSVLQDVLAKDPLVLADQSVYHFFQSLRTPWADRIFIGVTEFGDSFVNLCLAGAVFAALLGKHCYRAAVFWATAVLGGLVGVPLLKWAVHLPRPVALYSGTSAYGFPSGHTAMSVILYGCAAVLLAGGLAGSRRLGVFIAALLVPFIIAISRLYLGAHWLSDVLGGFFIGTSWVALLGIAYLKRPAESVPRRLLGVVIAVVIVFAGGWHAAQRHKKDLALYAPQHEVQSMQPATWSADGWQHLAAWRIDMAGRPEQPLTIQWAGSLDELERYLLTKGWQRPPPLNLRNFMGMLAPERPIEKLPVLALLHNGRIDRLRLVRPGRDNHRWVLRLWPSDFAISGSHVPLFVGTIENQHRLHLTWLITAAGDTDEYNSPRDALAQMLDGRFDLKWVGQGGHGAQVGGGNHRRLGWDGKVLLIRERAGFVR